MKFSPFRIFIAAAVLVLGCLVARSTQSNTAPQFDYDIPTQIIPCGKTLAVPIAAHDADGNALTYTVTSNNPHIRAEIKTGNPHLKMHVDYTGQRLLGTPAQVSLDFTQWDGNALNIPISGVTGTSIYSGTIAIPAAMSGTTGTTGTAGSPPSVSFDFTNWNGMQTTFNISGPNGGNVTVPNGTGAAGPVITLEFANWDGTSTDFTITQSGSASTTFTVPAGNAGELPPDFGTGDGNWTVSTTGSTQKQLSRPTATYPGWGIQSSGTDVNGGTTSSGIGVTLQDGSGYSVPTLGIPSGWSQSVSGEIVTVSSSFRGSGHSLDKTSDQGINATLTDGTDVTLPTISTPPPNFSVNSNGNVMTFTALTTGSGYSVTTGTFEGIVVSFQDGTPDPFSTAPGAQPFSGDLEFQLFRDLTPTTAGIIGGLAQGGFYNGIKFHRIANLFGNNSPAGVIAQGGDPTATGTGGPGFTFDNEFHPGLIFAGRGQLAMANAGFDSNFNATNGSQFFITNGQQRHLDFNHTIFGQLVRGFDSLDRIANVPVDSNGAPTSGTVVIQSAQVVPNNTDAVIYLSAVRSGTATITVAAWDGKTFASDGKTPLRATKTFQTIAADDTVNDPAFIQPIADVVTPLNKAITVPLKAIDLEFDSLQFATQVVSGTSIGSVVLGGQANAAVVSPNANASGPFTFVAAARDFTTGTGDRGGNTTTNGYDFTTVTVGIGDKKITAQPLMITTSSNVMPGDVLALLTDNDPAGNPGQYTATVNFGDGSPVLSSTSGGVTILAQSGSTSQPFKITFSGTTPHTYPQGQYPLTVSVSDSAGSTSSATSTVFVNPLGAKGVSLVTRGGVNGPVASFAVPVASVSNYTATVNWGDGVVTNGAVVSSSTYVTTSLSGTTTVITGTMRAFNVTGKHTYKFDEPFTVGVTIVDTGTAASTGTTTVWSTVDVQNANLIKQYPPFAQGHLVGNFVPQDPRDPNHSPISPSAETITIGGVPVSMITASIVVLNSGNKTVEPSSLKFFIQDNHGNGFQLPVSLHTRAKSIPLAAIAPNFGYRFDFHAANPLSSTSIDTRLPAVGISNASGLFLVVEMNYHDPLADHEAVSKVFSAQIQ